MVPVSQLVVFIIQLLHLEQLDGQVVSYFHKTHINIMQRWGSVTFWCGSGSAKTQPLTNGSDSCLHCVLGSKKNNFFHIFFS
jgi:hypothetical protein